MSQPLLVSIPETGHQLGVGRTKVYGLIDEGELDTVHIGDRHLVTAEPGVILLDGGAS